MAAVAVGCAPQAPESAPQPEPLPVAKRPRPRPIEPLPAPYQADPSGDAYHNTMVREVHAQACEHGNLESCDYYASMLRSGVGGPPDQIRAYNVSQRACNMGHNPSCQLASAQRQRIARMRYADLRRRPRS
jgi:TPR repeat protein